MYYIIVNKLWDEIFVDFLFFYKKEDGGIVLYCMYGYMFNCNCFRFYILLRIKCVI